MEIPAIRDVQPVSTVSPSYVPWYQKIEDLWSKLTADLAQDKDGHLDSQVKSDAAALYNQFNNLDGDSQKLFLFCANFLFNSYTENGTIKTADNTYTDFTALLKQLKDSDHPYDTFTNTVNKSITSVTYDTGSTVPIDFATLFTEVLVIAQYFGG